jgi:hypothetical protein
MMAQISSNMASHIHVGPRLSLMAIMYHVVCLDCFGADCCCCCVGGHVFVVAVSFVHLVGICTCFCCCLIGICTYFGVVVCIRICTCFYCCLVGICACCCWYLACICPPHTWLVRSLTTGAIMTDKMYITMRVLSTPTSQAGNILFHLAFSFCSYRLCFCSLPFCRARGVHVV